MTITENNFLFKLSALRKSAFSFLEMEMEAAGVVGIPPSFGDILYIVHRLGNGFIKDITAESFRDKSTVSNIINQLEQKGYVRKTPSREDARRVRVSLTDRATGYVESMAKISEGLKKQLFEGMSVEEQAILFLLLGKVEKNLKK